MKAQGHMPPGAQPPQMNGRRFSQLMQEGNMDKKVPPQASINCNNNEAVGSVVQTIKSSEFTKIDHTRS